MNSLHQIYALIKSEFVDCFRSASDILSAIYFAVIGLLIFHIAVGPSQIAPKYFTALLYTVQIFAGMMIGSNLFERDFKTGFIAKLITSGFEASSICIARYIFFVLYSLLIFAVSILLSVLWYDVSTDLLISHATVYSVYIAGYCAVTMMLSLLSMLCANKMGLFVIAFPFTAPLIMIATLAVEEAQYVQILLGLFFVYFAVLLTSFRALVFGIAKAF